MNLREIFDKNKTIISVEGFDKKFDFISFEQFEQAIADYEKSKWVSVEERKPEAFQEVLVILENGMISKGVTDYSGSWFIYFMDGRKEEYYENTVTHFQSLPTTPKP